MAPKKQKQEEWSQCLKCQRVVHRADLLQHGDSCAAQHGYIESGVLHAYLTAPNSQTKEVLSSLPLHNRDTMILVHPSAMTLCGLAIGQPCLLNGRHVLTSWPCDTVTPTCILPPPLVAALLKGSEGDKGSLVTLERFSPSGLEAHQVEIELGLEKEDFLSEDFTKVLKRKMEGHYITEDVKHTVRFFGQTCTFCIRSIQQLRPLQCELTVVPSSADHAEQGELCQGVAALNLSCISDCGDSSDSSLLATPSSNSSVSGVQAAMSPVLDTPSKPSGSTMQSPVAGTPVRGDVPLSGQFHTPVVSRTKECCRDCSQFVKVTSHTQFVVKRKSGEGEDEGVQERRVRFDQLGGLDRQIEKIRLDLILPLQASVTDSSVDLPYPRGVLLFGPTGTGKSLLAQAISAELGVHTVHVSPDHLVSKFFGETEKKLRAVFESARQRSPSLIVVDNIDTLCPRRGGSQSDLEKRTVTTFLTLMDGVTSQTSRQKCVVIGVTSKPDSLDPALRRAGRFDMEIETGVPTAPDRLQILKKLLEGVPHSISDPDLKSVADSAHGYVGADLAGVVMKARQQCWKETGDTTAKLTVDSLQQAARLVPPSAMREVQFEVPQVRWSDIGGMENVKLNLQQVVDWPLFHREAFQRMGITPPRGVLMYGPPGCSKTMIAKALATESGLNFLAVKGPELFSKYVGESERAVREVFRKARSAAPAIIFFDEIDSLAMERGKSGEGSSVAERVLTQLLTEMDGVVELKGVVIVAATNRPDMIDKALLRPGRFDRILYVPLPDADTRRDILTIVTRKTPVAPDVSLEDLVSRTERFSGAELTALCHEAGMCAMTESRQAQVVHRRHFDAALRKVQPRTTPEMIKFYEEYSSSSGQRGMKTNKLPPSSQQRAEQPGVAGSSDRYGVGELQQLKAEVERLNQQLAQLQQENKALKAENSELKTGHCAVRQTMQILSGQQSGGT